MPDNGLNLPVTPSAIKLGKRLQTLHDLIPTNTYDVIWDCCCDHGQLGMNLLTSQKAPCVKFNDIVPELIATVESKLNTHFAHLNWHVCTTDLLELRITQHTKRTLIIIAGVGGELTARFVRAIIENNPTCSLDFLLCPVRDLFALRTTLIDLKLHLVDEVLLKENQRFYELIWLSSDPSNTKLTLTEIGTKIWLSKANLSDKDISAYKKRILQHYNKAKKTDELAYTAFNAYSTQLNHIE